MKRRVYYRILKLWMISMFAWFVVCSYAQASETEPDYVVTPVITDFTLEEEPYFALKLGPSRKQVIEVEVRNNTDRDAVVYTGFYTAIASEDGTINYIGPEEPAETGKIKLSDLISGESGLTIPAGKAYVFQFTVTMPANGLDTPVAGGLAIMIAPRQPVEASQLSQITKIENQNQKTAKLINLAASDNTLSAAETIREGLTSWLSEGNVPASVSAEFSYVVPLFLETGEITASPNLTLLDIVSTDYANEIKAKIQNATTISAEDVTIMASVRKKGKKEIFFEVSEEHISIPAHTDYELTIPSKGKPVRTGEYTLLIKLTIGNTEWKWETDFTISDKVDNIIESGNVDHLESNTKVNWSYIIIPILSLFAVSLLIFIFLYKKKQKEDEAILEAMKNIRKLII